MRSLSLLFLLAVVSERFLVFVLRKEKGKKDFRKYMQAKMLIREEENFIMHILSNDAGWAFLVLFAS